MKKSFRMGRAKKLIWDFIQKEFPQKSFFPVDLKKRGLDQKYYRQFCSRVGREFAEEGRLIKTRVGTYQISKEFKSLKAEVRVEEAKLGSETEYISRIDSKLAKKKHRIKILEEQIKGLCDLKKERDRLTLECDRLESLRIKIGKYPEVVTAIAEAEEVLFQDD